MVFPIAIGNLGSSLILVIIGTVETAGSRIGVEGFQIQSIAFDDPSADGTEDLLWSCFPYRVQRSSGPIVVQRQP